MFDVEKFTKDIEDSQWDKILNDFHCFVEHIKIFEKSTSENFQVCAAIDGVVFILDKLSIIKEGHVILIEGHLPNGDNVLNVRQAYPLNLLLLRRQKEDAKEPRQKIGFSILNQSE